MQFGKEIRPSTKDVRDWRGFRRSQITDINTRLHRLNGQFGRSEKNDKTRQPLVHMRRQVQRGGIIFNSSEIDKREEQIRQKITPKAVAKAT